MNLQHLECSAHRNCLQEGNLQGLTKVTFGAVSRLPLFWWFSASSESSHPLQAAMRPEWPLLVISVLSVMGAFAVFIHSWLCCHLLSYSLLKGDRIEDKTGVSIQYLLNHHVRSKYWFVMRQRALTDTLNVFCIWIVGGTSLTPMHHYWRRTSPPNNSIW